jgi:hypothetical protein
MGLSLCWMISGLYFISRGVAAGRRWLCVQTDPLGWIRFMSIIRAALMGLVSVLSPFLTTSESEFEGTRKIDLSSAFLE